MGICLSCLKKRKPEGETEPLLYAPTPEQVEEITPKTRDLTKVISYVSDHFVDIGNLNEPMRDSITQPANPLEFSDNWRWPELGPLGEQTEQMLDDVYSTLKSFSTISLETPTPLAVSMP